jgi:hypothetical protein
MSDKLYNKEIHDNLLDLGYEYDGRIFYDRKRDNSLYLDTYIHPNNDDWFGINDRGHFDPLHFSEYTEGSEKGIYHRQRYEYETKRIAQTPFRKPTEGTLQ